MIDLRSDTVSKPSPEMRRAMAEAEVGDDVFGEDPSVNRLQEVAAQVLGKEAALYVPSGTMANQISVKVHTQPGDEVIMERTSHPFNSESGGLAALSGVQVNLLDGQRGTLAAEQVARVIRRGNDVHNAPTRLVSLENTHNRGGGAVYPIDRIREIHDVARAEGIAMHLDGARLLNASVASGMPAPEIAQYFDSCTLCLSKGLGAPVGSVIAASEDFIARAQRYRKMFGGGMRQAGILAAAAIYALENNVDRLADDHQNAKLLAERISGAPGMRIEPSNVETNIIYLQLDPAEARVDTPGLAAAMRQRGVLALAMGRHAMRLVTHLDVSREQVEQAADIMCNILNGQ
ncbi:MAG: low-specificity L-threonine aldolase [Candidatus Tectomicrobia bacterium]|nr:low-specificity L-threonine aldolase [Candidatus Tectomicrobia bacterium]